MNMFIRSDEAICPVSGLPESENGSNGIYVQTESKGDSIIDEQESIIKEYEYILGRRTNGIVANSKLEGNVSDELESSEDILSDEINRQVSTLVDLILNRNKNSTN